MKKAFKLLLFVFCACTTQRVAAADSLDIVVIFGQQSTLDFYTNVLKARYLDSSFPSGARLWRVPMIPIVIGNRTFSMNDPATVIGVIGERTDAIGVSGNTIYALPSIITRDELNNHPSQNPYPTLLKSNQNPAPFLPALPASSMDAQRDLKIYLLDTGVELANTSPPYSLLTPYIDRSAAWNFVDNNALPQDDHQEMHGTAVASIVTRYLRYLNIPSSKSIKITPLKVLNKKGEGSTFNIIKAIDKATTEGAHLINCSFAIKKRLLQFYGNAPLQIAINKAQEKGILFIAGAGNDNSNIECRPVYPASFANDNILTVGAFDVDEQKKASFSNYGKRSVDVFAPGCYIGTIGPDNKFWRTSGTSFSTPIVTGLVALIAAQMGDALTIDYQTIKQIILNSADGTLSRQSVKGVINSPQALRTL